MDHEMKAGEAKTCLKQNRKKAGGENLSRIMAEVVFKVRIFILTEILATSSHLLNSYYVPGTMLNALHV